ncbi:uncharacterized protein LOC142583482 [Dermacentor variabilis]|uniref:uncharacterized protein LOC142583482 n=1 Tax=Dermacentor variabilis TaxID=34621 RepID=UPI003F5C36B5
MLSCASSTTKIPTELRTSPGIRTTAVHSTDGSVRRSRVTRTDGREKFSSDSRERRDASSTGVGKRHGSNPDVKNATKGSSRGTRQYSRTTESTAAKATIPKRPELPRQTTSGGDLLETEKAVTNGTTDRDATDTGTASGLAHHTKEISHEDVIGLFSEADEKATSEGHSQQALIDGVKNVQTDTYWPTDTNKYAVQEKDDPGPSSLPNVVNKTTTVGGLERRPSDISIPAANDTKAPFTPNELTAKAVPRETPTSITLAVT